MRHRYRAVTEYQLWETFSDGLAFNIFAGALCIPCVSGVPSAYSLLIVLTTSTVPLRRCASERVLGFVTDVSVLSYSCKPVTFSRFVIAIQALFGVQAFVRGRTDRCLSSVRRVSLSARCLASIQHVLVPVCLIVRQPGILERSATLETLRDVGQVVCRNMIHTYVVATVLQYGVRVFRSRSLLGMLYK